MSAAWKAWWLDLAEVVDALRIVPRIMLVGFFVFWVWYIVYVTHWYTTLESPTGWDTGFLTGTITAIGTMFTWFGNTYVNSGRKWPSGNGSG